METRFVVQYDDGKNCGRVSRAHADAVLRFPHKTTARMQGKRWFRFDGHGPNKGTLVIDKVPA